MSVRRSPPSTPEPGMLMTTSGPLVQLDIESCLARKNKPGAPTPKRKFLGADDSATNSIISEMRIQFSKFSEEQDVRYTDLKTTVATMATDFSKSLEYLTQRNDEIADELLSLRTERAEDKAYIKSLEERLETADRRARNSCIEVRNVPKTEPSESKLDLVEVVKNLGMTVNTDIGKADIKDVYRIPSKKDTCPAIVVDFTSIIMKEEVISSCKKFNRGKKRDEKLNSRHLKLKGPEKPVYVSECLTSKSKKVFHLARDFAKTQGYQYCWTSNGVVYLRKSDNKPFARISDEQDLKKLMESTK